MGAWLWKLLTLVALTGATWCAVLGYWWSTQRVVSLVDVAGGLLALPLGLFGVVLTMRRALGGAPAQPVTATVASETVPAGDAAPAAPVAWPVLGAWVHTAAGADVESLWAALEAGQPRPRPDAQLRDREGLPLLSARMAALDTMTVEAALDAVGAAPATIRALAGLSPVLDEIGQRLGAWPERLAAGRAQAASCRIHVLALWPGDWTAAECDAAQGWLTVRLRASAAGTVAPAAWSVQSLRGTGAQALQSAGRLLDTLRHEGRDELVLLLACHSDLDDDAVQRLEQAQRLFALPHRPRGVVPGEAAAALLLADRAWPEQDGSAGVALQGLTAAPWAPSDGKAGRADAALEALLAQSFAAAGLEAPEVVAVVSDVEQHGDAARGLYALAVPALPHLDPATDLHLLGTLCGHTGAAAPLLTLALSCGRCRLDGKAVLALALAETGWRLAAVATPLAAKGPTTGAAAAEPQEKGTSAVHWK